MKASVHYLRRFGYNWAASSVQCSALTPIAIRLSRSISLSVVSDRLDYQTSSPEQLKAAYDRVVMHISSEDFARLIPARVVIMNWFSPGRLRLLGQSPVSRESSLRSTLGQIRRDLPFDLTLPININTPLPSSPFFCICLDSSLAALGLSSLAISPLLSVISRRNHPLECPIVLSCENKLLSPKPWFIGADQQ